MPRAFLSYSRDDAALVTKLENQFPAVGWDVWRDVQSLHSGDLWPPRLGDAIAAAERFVLVWSARAARSHFVRLEWAIAVAAKRPICILTIDDEPLPTTLRPYQAHPALPVETAVQWLTGITLERAPVNAAAPVLQKLAATPHREPSGIITELEVTFHQLGWSVNGPVYQAAGDIHLHLGGQQHPPARNGGQRLLYVLAIVSPVFLVIVAATVYRQYIATSSTHKSETLIQQELPLQPFGGFVQDERGLPLYGVSVTAPSQGIAVVTDRLGRFSFQVRLPADTTFRLIATKLGYVVLTADPRAGDTTFNFILRKAHGQ